jgi:hypothetical protein
MEQPYNVNIFLTQKLMKYIQNRVVKITIPSCKPSRASPLYNRLNRNDSQTRLFTFPSLLSSSTRRTIQGTS